MLGNSQSIYSAGQLVKFWQYDVIWKNILFVYLLYSNFQMISCTVYKGCELANILRSQYNYQTREIAYWVCIAQHASGLSTTLQTKDSHGIFQISEVYWCSTSDNNGGGCAIACDRLRDDDLTDDLACAQHIYQVHQRLSGDGYTAWRNVYEPYCQHNPFLYIIDCFDDDFISDINNSLAISAKNSINFIDSVDAISNTQFRRGKIYSRCELARELYEKHNIPMTDIATWVCIAEHESRFDTTAVGRLNTDGSADHGLFQISDLYWCSHNANGGKGCHISCNKLLDDDIADDVECIKRIHYEHNAISGDGFTAWTVYPHYCRHQTFDNIATCFAKSKTPDIIPMKDITPSWLSNIQTYTKLPAINSRRENKIYTKCSLAKELHSTYKFALRDVAVWVCIVKQLSNFNTSALAAPNNDGSASYGLFQINGRFWCSTSNYAGGSCNIRCNNLIDNDISDDVRCIRIIYAEHTRILGDGFTAWTPYEPYCQYQQIKDIEDCFQNYNQHNRNSNDAVATAFKGNAFNEGLFTQQTYRNSADRTVSTNHLINTHKQINYSENFSKHHCNLSLANSRLCNDQDTLHMENSLEKPMANRYNNNPFLKNVFQKPYTITTTHKTDASFTNYRKCTICTNSSSITNMKTISNTNAKQTTRLYTKSPVKSSVKPTTKPTTKTATKPATKSTSTPIRKATVKSSTVKLSAISSLLTSTTTIPTRIKGKLTTTTTTNKHSLRSLTSDIKRRTNIQPHMASSSLQRSTTISPLIKLIYSTTTELPQTSCESCKQRYPATYWRWPTRSASTLPTK